MIILVKEIILNKMTPSDCFQIYVMHLLYMNIFHSMPHNLIMLKYSPFLRKKKMLKVFSITASHKMGLYFIVWIETSLNV